MFRNARDGDLKVLLTRPYWLPDHLSLPSPAQLANG